MAGELLRLRIGVDGSTVIPDTMAQASKAVAIRSSQMAEDFAKSMDGVASGANDFGRSMTVIEKKAEYSMLQARESVRGLGEQIGVQLPKMVSNFIAEVPQIGSMMSAAFSAIAVVSLIQVLMEVPAAFEKISASVTGWDETAKKAYDHQLDLNRQYIDQLKETERAQRDLNIVGKTGSDEKRITLANERDDVKRNQEELRVGQVQVAKDMARMAELEEQTGFHIRDLLNPGMRLFVNHVEGAGDEMDKLKKRIESTTEANVKLDLAIKKAQGQTLPKAGAEVSAEVQKEAQKAAEERAAIEKRFRDVNQQIELEHQQAALKQVQDANKAADDDAKKAGETQIAIREEYAKHLLAMGEISIDEFTMVMADAENDRYALQQKFDGKSEAAAVEHQRRLAAIVADGKEQQLRVDQKAADDATRILEEQKREGKKIWDDAVRDAMEAGEKRIRDEQKRRAEGDRLFAQQVAKQRQTLQQVDVLFNQHIMNWVTGQQTLKQSLEQSWNAIATNAIGNLAKMAEQELLAHLMHKQLAKEGVLVDAKAAAASAFRNVMRALPFPADIILAPIAAAGAFAGVAAFGSFDQGGIVPNTGMHMLHKKEMVLDPMLSSGMQSLIMNGGGGKQSSRGGDVVLHYNASGAGRPDDHKKNAKQIVQIIKREQRRGALPSA